MSYKKDLHNIQNTLFDIIIYITYILILFSAFGFSDKAPEYLAKMDYYIKIYICLFLILRFNPLRSDFEFTELDRKISFSAGFLILTTTTLNQYLDDIKTFIKSFI
jgi:hypothetical protein